ncbi:hypothetical protein ACFL6I_09065 [candidate division KSB1 bacterium]
MAKKKSAKKERDRKQQPKGIPAIFSKTVQHWLFPFALFFILGLVYFAPLIFENNAILSSEVGVYAYGETGGSLDSFSNPFAEKQEWIVSLGGMPNTEGLNQYIYNLLVNTFMTFFYDFRAIGLYLALLSAFAAASMYLFLRALNIGRLLSFILGIAYQLSPHFMSFTYSTQYAKMGVVAITPLLFLFLHKGMHSGKLKYFIWLGFLMAADIFFINLQAVHFSFVALGLYFLYLTGVKLFEEKNYKFAVLRTLFFIFTVVLGLGMGARGFLPPYLYSTTDSRRAGEIGEGLGLEYASSYSLHAEEVASLAVPEFGNYDIDGNFYWGKNPFKINADYFGGILFVLALLSIFHFRKNREVQFFFFLLMFGLLFGLGKTNPVYMVMYYVFPGIKTFRAPALMLTVTAFSAFVLSGIYLQQLESQKQKLLAKRTGYLLFGIAGLCLLGAAEPNIFLNPWKALFYSDMAPQKAEVLAQNIPQLEKGFLVSLLFFSLFGAALVLYGTRKLRYHYILALLIPIFILDFWRIDKDFLNVAPVTPGVDISGKKDPAYEYLKNLDAKPFRVWPNHVDIKQKWYYSGVDLITGMHDFTMRRYDEMQLTVPRYGQEGLRRYIDLLCGKYIVIPGRAVNAVFNSENYSIIENQQVLPYFYVRNHAVVQTDEQQIMESLLTGMVDFRTHVILEEQPLDEFVSLVQEDSAGIDYSVTLTHFEHGAGDIALDVTLDTSGFLVFSDNFHKDWKAQVDGNDTKIYRANYLFQGVFLNPGDHSVTFQFSNPSVTVSRRITGISFILFVVLAVFAHKGYFDRLTLNREDIPESGTG